MFIVNAVPPGNGVGDAGTNLPSTLFSNARPSVTFVVVVSVTALLTNWPTVFAPRLIVLPVVAELLAALKAAFAVFLATWSTEPAAALLAA